MVKKKFDFFVYYNRSRDYFFFGRRLGFRVMIGHIF